MNKKFNSKKFLIKICDIPVHFRRSCLAYGIAVGFLPKIFGLAWWAPLECFYIGTASILLLLAHEMGHAIAAKLNASKVHGIIISGWGGTCFATLPEHTSQKILYFLGGLILQLIILSLIIAASLLGDISSSSPGKAICFVFIYINMANIVLNLLPIMNTDGLHILKIFKAARKY